MIHASKNGYYDVVKMLVDNGADKNIKDRFGKTALSYAIFEKQKGIAELLKNNDATLERKDVKKQTPPELGK